MPEEVPQPLTTTLSIAPGMSVGSRVTDVAERYGINISPEITALLQAVNDLTTHIDSRMDGDKPNSLPYSDLPSEMRQGMDLPWQRYLAHLYGDERGLPARQLTEQQVAAIRNLRTHFDTLQLPEEQRVQFVRRTLGWIYAGAFTKTADHLYGNGGYVRARYREGRLLASVFVEALPQEVRLHSTFPAFARMVGRLIGGYKLMDSYTDLSSDRKNGNTALRWTALGKMAVVLSGVRRLPNIIVRQPGLLPAIVGKMRAANANKDDSRNAERTQE